jgi:hypothetical protein
MVSMVTLCSARVIRFTDSGVRLSDQMQQYWNKLKGVWYRGRYLHDGSVASLEEMFNPERLKETHVPGGYRPLGTETRAIPGDTFGLILEAEERRQLIAFLKTL